jgi:O-antigen ligase/tetratricopeptide (TPR) repeat protein
MRADGSIVSALSRRSLQALLVSGVFVTLLLCDPFAVQGFREPKMAAMTALAGLMAAAWGLSNLSLASARKAAWLPPAPFWAFLPLIVLLVYRIHLDWRQYGSEFFGGSSIPVKIHYRIHILLPVLAWCLTVCAAFLGLRSNRSRRGICLAILLALSVETGVVILEIIGNRLGTSLNPLSWFAEIDLMGQVVKERIYGTIGNPNFVAGYLAIAMLPVLGWAAGGGRSLPARMAGVFVLAATLLALVATRSKGGLLALGTGLGHFAVAGAMLWGKSPVQLVEGKLWTCLKAGLIVVLLVLITLAGWTLADSTASPEEGSYLGRWIETVALRGDSIAVRALLAECGFRMWRQSPWTGLGPGEFKAEFLENLRAMLGGPDAELYAGRVARLHSLRANHLHNEYLQVLVEWGAVGLVFVELFLVWSQWIAVQAMRRTSSLQDRWIRLGLLSGFWAGLGGSLFDLPFHRPSQVFLLAVLLGASLVPSETEAPPEKLHPRGNARRFISFAGGIALMAMGVWMVLHAAADYTSLREVFLARAVLNGRVPGADVHKAAELMRQSALRTPGEGDYAFSLAYCHLYVENDPNAAISQVRRARLICDDPDTYILEARAQIERNNSAAAEPLLSFLEALNRDRPGLHYLKGRVWQASGNLEAARSAYLTDIHWSEVSKEEANPDLPDCYLRLAGILEQLGDFREAVTQYEKFLKLLGSQVPTVPVAQLSLGRMFRDKFYDYGLAEKYFSEALAIYKRQGNQPEVERVQEEIRAIGKRRLASQREGKGMRR